MPKDSDPISHKQGIMQTALQDLGDQIMSALHSRQLREESVSSEMVRRWLREFYDVTRAGLGEPPQFRGNDRDGRAR